MFTECRREDLGKPSRVIEHNTCAVLLEPRPMSDYHLKYDANWLPRANYLSESGGRWSQPFDKVCREFGHGQLHVLVHPDWWANAFAGVTV